MDLWFKNISRFSNTDLHKHVSDAENRVKFIPDNTDLEGAVFDFFAQMASQLRRNRVQDEVEITPRNIRMILIKKLEPTPRREMLREDLDFWDEQQEKYELFRSEVTRVSTEMEST